MKLLILNEMLKCKIFKIKLISKKQENILKFFKLGNMKNMLFLNY